MRSDNLQRHMNVHEIKFLDEDDASFNQLDMNVISRTPTKRKIEQVDEEDLEKLRKSLIRHNDEYNRKIFLGKKVYTMGKGSITGNLSFPQSPPLWAGPPPLGGWDSSPSVIFYYGEGGGA